MVKWKMQVKKKEKESPVKEQRGVSAPTKTSSGTTECKSAIG